MNSARAGIQITLIWPNFSSKRRRARQWLAHPSRRFAKETALSVPGPQHARNRGPRHARNRGPRTARFWLAGAIERVGVVGRAGVEEPKGVPVLDVIGEEPAKIDSAVPMHPATLYTVCLAHLVKPLLTSKKPPNSFRFLCVHGLYVHICIPKNILFARYSPLSRSIFASRRLPHSSSAWVGLALQRPIPHAEVRHVARDEILPRAC